METDLSKVKTGQSAVVKRVLGAPELKQRLMDMGITKGVKLNVVKLAPLGDPMEICVRGYLLSLRRQEAENILVY